jgi:hypothetical protein
MPGGGGEADGAPVQGEGGGGRAADWGQGRHGGLPLRRCYGGGRAPEGGGEGEQDDQGAQLVHFSRCEQVGEAHKVGRQREREPAVVNI